MNLTQLCALAILAAALGLVLRETGSKAAAPVLAVGGLALFVYAVSRLGTPLAVIGELAAQADLGNVFSSVLRMLAVAWLAHLSGEICRDLGAPTLAARVELCGRIEILLLALPSIEEICRLAVEVLP